MKYFVGIGDVRQGPFTEEAIREKAKAGDLGPDNLTWCDAMDDWEPLSKIFPDMEYGKKASPLPDRLNPTKTLKPDVSENKSTPIGIIVAVAVIAIVAGIFIWKSGNNEQQAKTSPENSKPEKPKFDLTKGLVAYYPFNGNANDESGNGNHGTVNGATLSTDRNGTAGKAYSFDGPDDYIIANDSPSLRPDYITISAWVYAASGYFRAGQIVGKTAYTTAEGEQYALGLGSDLKPGIHIKRDAGGAGGAGWGHLISSSPIVADQWTQITGTWDGNSLKIYVGGQLTGSNDTVPDGGIDNGTGGNLQIGRWWKEDPRHFGGKLDDIRIYNRALSEKEVAFLHTQEKSKN